MSTKKQYVKPEIKQDNSVNEKVKMLMNEVKLKAQTELKINLNNKAAFETENFFRFETTGNNSADKNILMEHSNMFVTETLIFDLLTVIHYHKNIQENYKKEAKEISIEFDRGLISKAEFANKFLALRIKYKIIN